MSSETCFSLDQSKILSSGNGLTVLGQPFTILFPRSNDIWGWGGKTFENIVGKGKKCF